MMLKGVMVMGKLWCNGIIYTMKNQGETVEAVFTENGIIKAVGEKEKLRQEYKHAIEEVINLQGSVMYPGFVDSHMHLIGHGERLMRLDLSQAKSKEGMLHLLERKAEELEEGEWLIGEAWNENEWDDKSIPTAEELDNVSKGHPLIARRICHHASLANSYSLKLASINKHTSNPPGGVIVKNSRKEPTGMLLDRAQDLVTAYMPPVSKAYVQKALQMGIEDCLKVGLTGGHTEDLNYYTGFKETYEAFLYATEQSGYKFRLNLLVHHEVVGDMIQYMAKNKKQSSFVELDAMKIFSDGSLGSRSALLSIPYKDDPSTNGVAIHTREELQGLVKAARSHGMNVAVHAIGDLAYEYVLESLEAYPPKKGQRDRIIHAQILRDDLIQRTKKIPVVLDVQPRFVASDFPWILDKIGENTFSYLYPWKTLLQEGIMCAGGSDAPIEPVNPLLGIHAAVTTKRGPSSNIEYIPSEKLSVYEAIKLFTEGSAQAVCRERERGKIAEGYLADFTVLEQDLFTIAEDAIPNVGVSMTVVDETIMFEKNKENREF